MSESTLIHVRATSALSALLEQRLSLTDDATAILSRAAARYELICADCVPAELTDAHWEMIYDALSGVPGTDWPNLTPGRDALRDYVEFYAAFPRPSPVAMHLVELMARWTTAEWVAVLDRAERQWRVTATGVDPAPPPEAQTRVE